jgi:hypothetical protein
MCTEWREKCENLKNYGNNNNNNNNNNSNNNGSTININAVIANNQTTDCRFVVPQVNLVE